MQQVFVGDIQGCADEFEGLLESLQMRFGVDFELWVVGDVVNRGPQSLRALSLLRDWVENRGAHYVLGNHEIALLRTAAGLRSPRRQDTFGDVLERPASDGWFDWLRSRPLVETGRLGRQPFAIVHAGVHPDWSLDELVARDGGSGTAWDVKAVGRQSNFSPPILAKSRVAPTSNVSLGVGAWRPTGIGSSSPRWREPTPGIFSGPAAATATESSTATGRSRASTWHRASGVSIRDASTTAADAMER